MYPYVLNKNNKEKLKLQKALNAHIKRLKTFLNYSKNYLIRNNPFKVLKKELIAGLKDAFSINKKRKLIKYKLKFYAYMHINTRVYVCPCTCIYMCGCVLPSPPRPSEYKLHREPGSAFAVQSS